MRPALLLAVVLVLSLGGCGLGPGEELGGGAELRVTRDFGATRLASAEQPAVTEGQTVMRFLQAQRKVETRYGGAFVQSIDGLSGSSSGGRRDWFYFVNGIEAQVGAAEFALSPGDVVQWDHRRWEATPHVPAIVGAYPEPFLHGTDGKRVPTRVECEDERSAACAEVKRRLGEAGVPVTGAPLGAPAGPDILRVVVGTWPGVRFVRALQPLERGPAESGVFARISRDGTRLDLLDESGRPARQAPAGTGLVAATSQPGAKAVWVLTGVDGPGVEAAARTLSPEALSDAFAVAVEPRGPVDLPVRPR